jgi:hypothetical protein
MGYLRNLGQLGRLIKSSQALIREQQVNFQSIKTYELTSNLHILPKMD